MYQKLMSRVLAERTSLHAMLTAHGHTPASIQVAMTRMPVECVVLQVGEREGEGGWGTCQWPGRRHHLHDKPAAALAAPAGGRM